MTTLDAVRGGLIVSVQAWPGSAIDEPSIIAAMARAAQENGAVAVRIAGVDNIAAVRARVDLPIVGLIKREYRGYAPYITPTCDEVAEVVGAGADIVAFDATSRERPGATSLAAIVEAIHAAGRIAMADCASTQDAQGAKAAGADVVGTTLCGYTAETAGHALPALDLVAEFAKLGVMTICEGGILRPEEVAQAFAAGADAVVVGTAITNVDWLVRAFAGSARVRGTR